MLGVPCNLHGASSSYPHPLMGVGRQSISQSQVVWNKKKAKAVELLQRLKKKRAPLHGHALTMASPQVSPTDICGNVTVVEVSNEATCRTLPFSASETITVENWGTFYNGPKEEKYWNHSQNNNAFPYLIGYTATKLYKGRVFRQYIKEGRDGPLFVVEEPGKPPKISDTPTKAWIKFLQDEGQVSPKVNGARHFGFQSDNVRKVLKEIVDLRSETNQTVKEVDREEEKEEEEEEEVYKSLGSSSQGSQNEEIKSGIPLFPVEIIADGLLQSSSQSDVSQESVLAIENLENETNNSSRKIPSVSSLISSMQVPQINGNRLKESKKEVTFLKSTQQTSGSRSRSHGENASYHNSKGSVMSSDDPVEAPPQKRINETGYSSSQKWKRNHKMKDDTEENLVSKEEESDANLGDESEQPYNGSIVNELNEMGREKLRPRNSSESLIKIRRSNTSSSHIRSISEVIRELVDDRNVVSETDSSETNKLQHGKMITKSLGQASSRIAIPEYEESLFDSRDMDGSRVNEALDDVFLQHSFDPWQKEISKLVQEGNNVLVAAPNGAGKSTAALYCLHESLAKNHRSLLVTPNEGLAEQYFARCKKMYGSKNVGIYWNGAKVHSDTKLVILTVSSLAYTLHELHGPGGSDNISLLKGVRLVVMDKFDTIGDATSGSLWQEILFLMNPTVKVIALSLPTDNLKDLVSWIDHVRGPCKLVMCKSDPIPKQHYICDGAGLHPLLDSTRAHLNTALNGWKVGDSDDSMTNEKRESFFLFGYDKMAFRYVVRSLKKRSMLPAMAVFFTVEGCNAASNDVLEVSVDSWLTSLEITAVEKQLNRFFEANPVVASIVGDLEHRCLRKGIAVYHDGKLPIWQQFLETLMQDNLVRFIITTHSMISERDIFVQTVIVSSTCILQDKGVSVLSASEFERLNGHAGRRGFDEFGNVVFLKNFCHGPKEAAALVLGKGLRIVPHYQPSYSLLVNMLAKYSLSKVQSMLQNNLAEYVSDKNSKNARIKELNEKVQTLMAKKLEVEAKLFQELAEVNREKLFNAHMFSRVDVRIGLQKHDVLPGVLFSVLPCSPENFYLILTTDNNFRLWPASYIDCVYTKTEQGFSDVFERIQLQPPPIPSRKRWMMDEGEVGYIASGNAESKHFCTVLLQKDVEKASDDVSEAKLLLASIKDEVELLQKDISSVMEDDNGSVEGQISENFLIQSLTHSECDRLLTALLRMDAVSLSSSQGAHAKLKPLGMLVSRMPLMENELWSAMLLLSSPLVPAEFAACATLLLSTDPQTRGYMYQREREFRISKRGQDVLAKLGILRKKVAAIQGSYTPALNFDTTSIGMVYTWTHRKPGSGNFTYKSVNDGFLFKKMKSVWTLVNLFQKACTAASIDKSASDRFENVIPIARNAAMLLKSRFLVDGERKH